MLDTKIRNDINGSHKQVGLKKCMDSNSLVVITEALRDTLFCSGLRPNDDWSLETKCTELSKHFSHRYIQFYNLHDFPVPQERAPQHTVNDRTG